jgi:TolB-like protein/Tfp pilus assembly protein PilF
VERRLAAILAADVVGYSRLMGEDETGTLERLKSLRKEVVQPEITERKGRIVKLMGDGLLAEFPSVIEAVQCAVQIQQSMIGRETELPDEQRIRLRIGVNLGDIIVEGSDIYGDGVNVAARLESVADPDGIFVSGEVFRYAKGKVKAEFEDMGERNLKNVAEPIRIYRIAPAGSTASATTALADAPPLRDKPSIAVLPFTNMSGDPEQRYFVDGICEDIITELSRFRSLFVIARNSSFAYRDSPLDLRTIGRELGVRYLTEGSIRRGGDRIRVTAQLIDAESGAHIWAERYDRSLEDIFDVQDEVTRRIVGTIAPLMESEMSKLADRKTPESITAYDHYLKARGLTETPRSIADMRRGRELCRSALALDPSYARAHAQLALSYTVGLIIHEADDIDEWQRQALQSAEKAVELDPLDHWCHWALSEAALHCGQIKRAHVHMNQALSINPNDADIWAVSCFLLTAAGAPEEGLRHMAKAVERNPSGPPWYHWLAGIAHYQIGQYETALQEFLRYGRPNPSVQRWRAASLVRLDRLDEARDIVQDMLEQSPGVTIGYVRRTLDFCQDFENLYDDLRLAGIPE